MYCPQCGQQQSEEIRYCSRCGLSLYEIGLWLGGSGELINPESEQRQVSPRRRHIRRCCKSRVLQWDHLPDWSVRECNAEGTAMVGDPLSGIPCEFRLDALLPALYERG